MTEKLYYENAYTREFTASVKCVSFDESSYAVVLDKTAFFPEEGGQSADTGRIGEAAVLDVKEKNGIIFHYVDRPVELGEVLKCEVNFEERFEKMQCHTAEHIISGTFKRLYGLDNVGFHLGKNEVTMDINGVLTRDDLDRVELLANKAVFDNIPVTAYFPSSDELLMLEYRSKLELTENVRIVRIGDIDICACCAPHVSSTGEIGIIKLLDFEKHKGGLRIYMAAGYRALTDYKQKYANVRRISAMLCEPQETVADGVDRQIKETDRLRSELKSSRLELARLRAEQVAKTDGNHIVLFDGMSNDELREFCNCAHKKVGGILLALSGEDGEFRYAICSERKDLQAIVKNMNTYLGGRGGGRGILAQGTLYSSRGSIEEFFASVI